MANTTPHVQIVTPAAGETEAQARIRFERIRRGLDAPEPGAWMVRHGSSGERHLTHAW